jgi:dTMP kinase
MKRGKLICIEGLDASGKETQSKLLVEYLEKEGHNVIRFDEPSNMPVGRLIKEALNKKIELLPETLALLFAADRIEDTKKNIIPYLEKGYVVICDRYVLSSLAYQTAMGLDLEWVKNLNKEALTPDLTIFMDLNPEQSLERLKNKELFDNLEFQKKVREKYLNLISEYEHIKVDAGKTIEKVHGEIVDAVRRVID